MVDFLMCVGLLWGFFILSWYFGWFWLNIDIEMGEGGGGWVSIYNYFIVEKIDILNYII